MRELSDDIQVLVSTYLANASLDPHQEFVFRHDTHNNDLTELLETVTGLRKEELISRGARLLCGMQQQKAIGVEIFMRSLIAAAVTEWVFKSNMVPPISAYSKVILAVLDKGELNLHRYQI
jgi:hypothetical protein